MSGRICAVLTVLVVVGSTSLAASASAPAAVPGDWYLTQDHVAEVQDLLPASVSPVRIAVLDSGVDGGHPLLAPAIASARSFVGGDPLIDMSGHGTFVAGEIVAVATAAAPRAPSLIQLLIGQITNGSSIEPGVEARAIYWAVENGARVINLSLGGLRDPHRASLDTYSPVEAAAVRYAIAHRVVVVAAVGNGDEAPSQPWPFASWPSALPHVIGVSAIDPDGSVPSWSNRDQRFNELAAPGAGIVATFPRSLTALNAGCPDQGYSDCGTPDFNPAEGTSFAAPQVSAAAGLLLAADPQLKPDQVSWLLERSADDATPATGCAQCAYGRDPLTGWGTLNIAKAIAALKRPIVPASPYEPTNDAGHQARPLRASHAHFTADLDYWENPVDVYRIHLAAAQQLWVTLTAHSGDTVLALWKPGTAHVQAAPPPRDRLIARRGSTATKTLHYRAVLAGWYYLEVALRAQTNLAYTIGYAVVR